MTEVYMFTHNYQHGLYRKVGKLMSTKEKQPMNEQKLQKMIVGFADCGLSERYHMLMECYALLVENGCDSYEFILYITKLEEKFGALPVESSKEIIDDFLHYNAECGILPDVAFAAVYYVALVYTRYREKEKLRKFLTEMYPHFENGYPLFYELMGRFCSLNNDFMRSVIFADKALRPIEERGGVNVALGVAYANAIASIAEYCFLHKNIYGERRGIRSVKNAPLLEDGICEIALKSVGPYVYDNRDLENGKIDIALEKIEKAIAYNEKYSKYYYLKSKLLFYRALYKHNKISEPEINQVRSLLRKCVDLLSAGNKNYNILIEEYNRFDLIVQSCPVDSFGWYETERFLFEAAKNNIIRAGDPKLVQPKIYDHSARVPHVFVSYSSLDFKAVYCDLIELRRNGIYCDYDNEMIAYEDVKDNEGKQKWYIAVESKIRSAECVICYLSADYINSGAVLRELQLIERYKKPIIAIDLSGDHVVSRMIVRMAQDREYSRNITSERLYWFAKKFEDDTNIITRAQDPLNNAHIMQIKNRIFFLCPNVVNVIKCESVSQTGAEANHPQEDCYLADGDHNVFIVADGVTRQNREEYSLKENSEKSISFQVGETFCRSFRDAAAKGICELKTGDDLDECLKAAFETANRQVCRVVENYLSCVPVGDAEKPGCVAIAAVIHSDKLHFGAIGDCMGILVRNNKKIVFSDKQTVYAFDKARVEKDRATLQREYINNPGNPYGYGVVNGEKEAEKFFNVSHLNMEYGDSIYLVSDGVSDYIQYCNPQEYESLSVEQILARAREMHARLKGAAAFCDDMTLIRIRWTSDNEWFKEEAISA